MSSLQRCLIISRFYSGAHKKKSRRGKQWQSPWKFGSDLTVDFVIKIEFIHHLRYVNSYCATSFMCRETVSL